MLRRSLGLPALLLLLVGCRLPNQEALKPLPDDAKSFQFADLVARMRGQAAAALDAHYVDGWAELELAAQRLEETSRFLPRSQKIPDHLASKVEAESDALRQDALKLSDAAKTKNASAVNDTIQRIGARIRQLRPAEKTAP
jgi:hypothetical protein